MKLIIEQPFARCSEIAYMLHCLEVRAVSYLACRSATLHALFIISFCRWLVQGEVSLIEQLSFYICLITSCKIKLISLARKLQMTRIPLWQFIYATQQELPCGHRSHTYFSFCLSTVTHIILSFSITVNHTTIQTMIH